MAKGKTGPSGKWGSRRRKRDLNGNDSALLLGEEQDDDVTYVDFPIVSSLL